MQADSLRYIIGKPVTAGRGVSQSCRTTAHSCPTKRPGL